MTHPYPRRKFIRVIALFGAVTLALSACDEISSVSEEEHIERAQKHRQAGDLRSSSIELKNALQLNPKSARARLLLGQLYVDIGDGASAEKELVRARDLGMDEGAIARPLGHAWILQRKYQKVLDTLQPRDDGSAVGRASILTLRGDAHAGLSQFEQAKSDYESALEEDPKSVDALVGMSRLMMAQNQIGDADKYLKLAEAESPELINVLILKGDVTYLQKDFKSSEAAFLKLYEKHPGQRIVLIGLARAQIGDRRYDEAVVNLDKVLKASPNTPAANYLRALAAYHQNDYNTAKVHVERVLNVVTSDLKSLLLSGASGFAVGELEHAKRRLTQFLSQVPDNEHARRLLGATLLRLAEADDALDQLLPLVEKSPQDAELLAMIAEAAVKSGDLDTGSKYYSQALSIEPDNPALRAELGATRIALGDDDAGIRDLEQALKSNPSLTQAELNVYIAHLRADRFDDALKSAKRMQEHWPDHAFGYTAEGIVLMRQNKLDQAKPLFSRAIEIAPGTPDASNNLSVIAERQGDMDKAKSILEEFLKQHPNDPRVLNRLSELTLKSGKTQDAKSLLETIVERSPNMVQPRSRLARMQLLDGKPQQALDLAQEGLKFSQGTPVYFDIMGQALTDLGRLEDAVDAYSNLVKSAPDSSIARTKLANAYVMAGKLDSAEKQFGEARKLHSGNFDAAVGLALIAAQRGQLDDANQVLESLEGDARQRPAVLEMEGDIALVRKNTDLALSKFYTALTARPTQTLVMKTLQVHRQRKEQDEANRLLETWITKFPDNLNLKYELAVQQTLDGKAGTAIETYRNIIAVRPDYWQAHNNLSALLLAAGDQDNAIKHAESAEAIEPDNPAVLDTLGKALIAKQDGPRALRVMNRAAAAGPQYSTIQYHLAEAMILNGKKEQARDVLEQVLARQSYFPEQGEAEELLQSLKAN